MTLALGDAMDRYAAAFSETPPLTMAVHSDDYPALIAAMDAAVKRGRRMSEAEVLTIAGLEDPGPGLDPDWPVVF